MPEPTNSFLRIWRLAAPYFGEKAQTHVRLIGGRSLTAPEGLVGSALLLSVVAISLAEVGASVLLNQWNAHFYNALQAKDLTAFWRQLVTFCWIAAALIVMTVYQLYLNQALQIRWRRWITSRVVANWLKNGTHYRLQIGGITGDNPDQRISEDINAFIDATLTLGLGLLSSLATLGSFTLVLWQISEHTPVSIDGYAIHVPGFLLWTAIAFSLLATVGAHRIGRPLTGLLFEQQRREADLRYGLVQVRDHSEPIALMQGGDREEASLTRRFAAIVTNWHAIMRRQKLLTFFTAGYSQAAVVLPFVVIAPAYLAGRIPLGTLTQTAGAFSQVQTSFSYFVTAYAQLAQWLAITERLSSFDARLHAPAAQRATGIVQTRDDLAPHTVMRLDDVEIGLPDGRKLASHVSFSLVQGESVLLRGASGSGKTTLLRAIAGYWPYARGRVTIAPSASLLLLPQQPYLPLGNLRAALCYPARPAAIPEAAVEGALEIAGMGRLIPQLDAERNWREQLSVGEQQRLAIARALIARPSILVLDEATSAVDENSEADLMCSIRRMLPETAILSVGHRSTLLRHNDHVIDLHAAGVRLTSPHPSDLDNVNSITNV